MNKQNRQQKFDTNQVIPIQHKLRAVYACFALCFGYIYNGYCTSIISTVSVSLVNKIYQINLNSLAQVAVVNAIIPIGAMVGVFFLSYRDKITHKKYMYYIYFMLTVIGCSISIIPNLYCLLTGRFIIGFLNVFYSTTASSYIRDIFPIQYRKTIGASYSAARIFGILLCYSTGYWFSQDTKIYYIFFGPAFIALIQLVFLYFIPLSPSELIKAGNLQQAERSLNYYYFTLDVQKRIKQIQDSFNEAKRQTLSFQGQRLKKTNYFSCLYLNMSRNFCGVSYLVVYTKLILRKQKISYYKESPLIINGVLFISALAGIYLANRFRRKYMLLYSCFFMCVLNLLIGCADLLSMPVLTLITMALFMIPCGAGFSSIVTYYGSQLVSQNQRRHGNFMNYFSNSLVIFIPPYVQSVTLNNGSYPTFFFFAAYLCISFYVYAFVLEQLQTGKRELPILIELQKKYKIRKNELILMDQHNLTIHGAIKQSSL